MVGHEDLKEIFSGLAQNQILSHGYIFFGEPQVGKLTFAKSLANFIETSKFEPPQRLQETKIIKSKGDSTSIGIDDVRELKNFLYQKPFGSNYRIAIIDNAEELTDQAQNAILKIAEEPPEHGLIIMTVANLETIIPTVKSRFQRVYFPRIATSKIEDFLIKEHKLGGERAKELSKSVFGRIGLAINLLEDDSIKSADKLAEKFINNKGSRKNIIADILGADNKSFVYHFFAAIIAKLAADTKANWGILKEVLNRLRLMEEWNTNRRIQIESALFWAK